jgi:glycosyltransferase involved in cell wall biosynthesis
VAGPGLSLPRLAVVSDVGVERTAAGSLLLYRLLADYPPDRLLAVDAGPDARWGPERRLPGVAYHSFPYGLPRLVRTRFNPAGPLLMTALARRFTRRVLGAVRPFAPDAVLTVTCGYLWVAAAAVARRLGVPLHLVLHDDWPSYQTRRKPGLVHDAVRWACRRAVGRAYRQAAVRFCVSPGMAEQCGRWFGRPGTLLYPNRGADTPEARVRVRPERGGGPVVAFCGHVHQDGALTLLRELAGVLAAAGGHLDLYTPHGDADLARWGLRPPVVRRVGFLAPADMAERLGQTADALFLPGSFAARERLDVATLFPSKLTDYTAVGLPILVWGPPYSSAARWALDNPGAAAVVLDPDPAGVAAALAQLVADRGHAAALAARALEVGARDFNLESARRVFLGALAATQGKRDDG